MTPQMSTEYAQAFRELLLRTADQATAPRRRRQRRSWIIGGGVAAASVLVGGVTAVALTTPPGSPIITEVAPPVYSEFTGTGTLDLGDPPTDATGITVTFACNTAGEFVSDQWGSTTCGPLATGQQSGFSYNVLPIPPSHSITVTTSSDAQWVMYASYVHSTSTAWGINDDRQTFGVTQGTPGGSANDSDNPDLIAVVATNGRAGYVLKADEAWATGHEAMQDFQSPEDAQKWQETEGRLDHSIPVYESDGKTVIGEFIVQGLDSQQGINPGQPPVTRLSSD